MVITICIRISLEPASIHEAGGYILIDLTVSDLKNLERQIAFEVALAGKATNQDHQSI